MYFCDRILNTMTTITIKNGEKLSRTHFENWEDFQTELIIMQEKFTLTPKHITILKSREEEADSAIDNGLSWEELKANISRKNV